jgi:hypothetical protein
MRTASCGFARVLLVDICERLSAFQGSQACSADVLCVFEVGGHVGTGVWCQRRGHAYARGFVGGYDCREFLIDLFPLLGKLEHAGLVPGYQVHVLLVYGFADSNHLSLILFTQCE